MSSSFDFSKIADTFIKITQEGGFQNGVGVAGTALAIVGGAHCLIGGTVCAVNAKLKANKIKKEISPKEDIGKSL